MHLESRASIARCARYRRDLSRGPPHRPLRLPRVFVIPLFRSRIISACSAWLARKEREAIARRADLRNSSAARPRLGVSNENTSLPVGGSRNPDAVAFSSACENFVICLNTLNYACAICRRLSTGFRGIEAQGVGEGGGTGGERGWLAGGGRRASLGAICARGA